MLKIYKKKKKSQTLKNINNKNYLTIDKKFLFL